MNWQRVAKRLLRIIAELRAENAELRRRIKYEQDEVDRLAKLTAPNWTRKQN